MIRNGWYNIVVLYPFHKGAVEIRNAVIVDPFYWERRDLPQSLLILIDHGDSRAEIFLQKPLDSPASKVTASND